MALLLNASQRGFRFDFQNPYKVAQVKITDEIREQQKGLPVWERTFDHSKYMQRQGPLKQTTGIGFLDVEPFPRLKLMKLYYLALEEAKHLPDIYGYKTLSIELTKFRMKVVDENENTRDIEEKIGFGMVEELILAAHNELKLLRIMREWAPWDILYNEDEEEDLEMQASMLTSRSTTRSAADTTTSILTETTSLSALKQQAHTMSTNEKII